MVDKNYSFYRNRLFTQNFPEDLQIAALTEPLRTAEKMPRVFAQYPKMMKKHCFTKYMLWSNFPVDCWIAFEPHCQNFSLTQTEILHSFSKKDKKFNFHNNYNFQQSVPLHKLKQKMTNQKKTVDRKPRTFSTLSEKDRKLMVFLKHSFFLKLLLWTRSISF